MINTRKLANAASDSTIISLFSSGIGLSIFNYLNPLHSPIGHDFLVNALAFILISLSLSVTLFSQSNLITLKAYSLSMYTWLSLAILLSLQPLLNTIRYPDALIFPVSSLILVMLVSLTATNLLSTPSTKRQFINQISVWLYVTLVLNFIVQIMQAMNQSIGFDGWPITRLSAIPDRLDGNFGQANHAAYSYVFGICCVMYQLHTLKTSINRHYYQWILLLLLVIFAIGMSLTKSRAVLIMLLASTLVYFFSQGQRHTIKNKLLWCAGILTVFVMSYLIGGMAMAALSPSKVDAAGGLGRIVSSGVDSQRIALTYKALMIFEDYPITGIGWRNFAVGAIPHVDEMMYVTFSDSSHMVFTHIASELGIIGLLCLVPVTYLIVRSLHTRHSPESAMALAFVIATGIYACFEYPLWYFRFLVVFGLFLTLIDQKNYSFASKNPKLPKIVGSVALVFAISGSYYVYQYWINNHLFWYAHLNLKTDASGTKKMVKNSATFGFLNYNDMDLATVIEISPEMLPQKLALFNRVLVDESSVYNLTSYGQLLSFNGEYDKALDVFKTACRIQEDKTNCGNIATALNDSAKHYPQNFQANAQAYKMWLETKKLQ